MSSFFLFKNIKKGYKFNIIWISLQQPHNSSLSSTLIKWRYLCIPWRNSPNNVQSGAKSFVGSCCGGKSGGHKKSTLLFIPTHYVACLLCATRTTDCTQEKGGNGGRKKRSRARKINGRINFPISILGFKTLSRDSKKVWRTDGYSGS